MDHKLDKNGLDDFSFGHILASASGSFGTKRLTAVVSPKDNKIDYVVSHISSTWETLKNEHESSLEKAIDVYNSI